MANEIYHANDVQLRQQIRAHLDDADTGTFHLLIGAMGTTSFSGFYFI